MPSEDIFLDAKRFNSRFIISIFLLILSVEYKLNIKVFDMFPIINQDVIKTFSSMYVFKQL